jgi:hypothetical protein
MAIEAGIRVLDRKLPVFEETPPRHPAPMPMQAFSYWTPRAAFGALLHGMTEGMGPHRVLRRAAIPVKNNDE